MLMPDATAPTGTKASPFLRRLVLLLAVSALVILADQATKRAVERNIRGRTVRVMPGFDLRYARNPGAAWGLLADVGERYRRPFFVGVSILAMAFIVFTYARATAEQRRLRLALALILGGAIGNFIDRMAYGYVVDFVDWHARLFGRVRHWPTFNIADAGITVGVLLLALDLFPRRARPEVVATLDSRGERAEGEGSPRPCRGEGGREGPPLEDPPDAKPDGAAVEVRK
ncbi:MAG: signal peptidase II [Deltaproteobacteria bacterium]|nr:signal peptidase II [Deltaproteobacteria bacterium]